jgi:hypothetical protein
MEPQVFQDIWFRRVWSSWANHEDWRTDIRQNVLNDNFVRTALFIFEDLTLVFIPMDEMRKALANVPPRANGSITFNVNAHARTIGNVRVKMEIHEPKKDNLPKENIFANFPLDPN